MQAPPMYSLESYEPPVLKPEEMKQNVSYLRRAFTDKKLDRYYFMNNNINNIPVMNPLITNNNPFVVNKNMITNNFPIKYNRNIQTTIPLNNPFITNNVQANNNNKVFSSIQFNNPFANQKINTIKYINPMVNKNNNQKNINQFQVLLLQNRNINRSKSSRYVQTFPQFLTIPQNNALVNNHNLPIYRRIINSRK